MAVLLEVCVASLEDALAAQGAGADRLELNAALELGGLTPSDGLVRAVLQAITLPLIVMVRPRAGGFCYGPKELDVMARDIDRALELGAQGLAVGALTQRDEIDVAACRTLMQRAAGCQVVFHRAFDAVADRSRALEQLIGLGVTRVLTSGGAPTAPEGAETIRQLVEQAAGRIEVLTGGGIRPQNVVQLLAHTGCRQVHGSLSRWASERSGGADARFRAVDPQAVRQVRRLLDRHAEAEPPSF